MTDSASSDASDPDPDPVSGDLDAVEAEAVDGEVVGDRHAEGHRLVAASSFRGPLPDPQTLREYDNVLPGLAREIVDQWKSETAHRHLTVDGLRVTDHEAMQAYYAGEKRGQSYALVCFLALIVVGLLALLLDKEFAGAAAIVGGGAGVIWSMRRSPHVPSAETPPVDLDDPDALQAER